MWHRHLPKLCALTVFASAAEPIVSDTQECGGNELSAWTSSERRAPGYHVLCFKGLPESCTQGASTGDGAEGSCAASKPEVSVCWDGLQTNCEKLQVGADLLAEDTGSWWWGSAKNNLVGIEELLVKQGQVSNQKRYARLKKAYAKKGKNVFAFFKVSEGSSLPKPLGKTEKPSGLVLAFEGGAFVWPGVKAGFTRNITVETPDFEPVKLALITKSLQPLIIEVSQFLDKSECEHVISKASPFIAKSAVSHMDHDVGKPDANWRTSSTHFLNADDNILRRLDARVGALTLTATNQQEHSQVLRYEKTEHYSAHHDYFNPSSYSQNADIQALTKKWMFNRLATVFFYLTDVEQGGETFFPRAGGLPQPATFEDCSVGIAIKPQKGRVIIFYSQNPAAQLDEYSLHGGCAVKNGTKWSANKWIWNTKMGWTP